MYPVKEFEKRFREILDALDEIKGELDDPERMEEMNAEFEDALFVIESICVEDEDWCEAFADALEVFKDLCGGYRAMDDPALAAVVDRLDAVIRLAEANLPEK